MKQNSQIEALRFSLPTVKTTADTLSLNTFWNVPLAIRTGWTQPTTGAWKKWFHQQLIEFIFLQITSLLEIEHFINQHPWLWQKIKERKKKVQKASVTPLSLSNHLMESCQFNKQHLASINQWPSKEWPSLNIEKHSEGLIKIKWFT